MPSGFHICLGAGIISCLIACFASQVLAAEPKRVLLLHPSSGINLRAAINIRNDLERQSQEPLEIYDASVVSGRPADEIVSDPYGDYLDSLFPDKRLDLAVVVGGAALRLFQRHRLKLEDMLNRVATLPPRSAIYFAFILADVTGTAREEDVAFPRLRSVANAPIFSYSDGHFGNGIVGGPLLMMQERSEKAVGAALRILAGEAPGDIQIPPVGFSTSRFDWREMQRWGIGEARLPEGSEIFFREPTAWEQYRWQIVAITAAILFQVVLIFGLLYEHRRRHEAEIQSRQRMSELAHMNRHATAGELSASIAHEINQPLGAIFNNAEAATVILNSAAPDMEEIRKIVEEIKREDERASEVILGLRRLLKKSASEVQSIDLNAMVREVFALLSAQAAARNVTLNSRFAPQPLNVSGDRVQLQQVILNLVFNGMDSIAGAAAGQREITSHTALLDDNSAEVAIADSGSGIPPDKLKQVFEPFFTTKEHGMGMGLSISRTIIEANGGRIWAENQSHGGAIFRVRLPLAKGH